MSQGDLAKIEISHIADSLSLASYVRRACGGGRLLLDIGSGGGFPAIPLKVVLPDVPMLLVERSVRKAAFLKATIQALGFNDMRVECLDYPVGMPEVSPGAVTARAVEQSAKVVKRIAKLLPADGVFLCQSGDPSAALGERFHVEHVDDWWTRQAMRRGSLQVVTHAECSTWNANSQPS